MTALRLTKDTFEQEVLKSDKPVAVFFFDDKTQDRLAIYDALAGDSTRASKAKIAVISVEDYASHQKAFRARAGEAAIFKGGEMFDTGSRLATQEQLEAWLDAVTHPDAKRGEQSLKQFKEALERATGAVEKARPALKGDTGLPLTKEEIAKIEKSISKSGLRGAVAAVTVPFAILPAVAGGIVLAAGAPALPAVAAVGAIGASVYRLYNLGKILQPGALEKSLDGLKKLLEKEKAETLLKPKKDAKYFAKASLKLGFSLAKLGTSVALFAVAAPMTGFAAFAATSLAVWMALQGSAGTLFRVPAMIRDVKEKIEHSFLKDLPPEEKPAALPAPQSAAPTPAVSAAEAGKDFAAAANPAVNDNKTEARPVITPPTAKFL